MSKVYTGHGVGRVLSRADTIPVDPLPLAGLPKDQRISRCKLGFLIGAADDDLQSISGDGRCSAFASFHGTRIQTSGSSSVVMIIGIAWGWIGSTPGVSAPAPDKA